MLLENFKRCKVVLGSSSCIGGTIFNNLSQAEDLEKYSSLESLPGLKVRDIDALNQKTAYKVVEGCFKDTLLQYRTKQREASALTRGEVTGAPTGQSDINF